MHLTLFHAAISERTPQMLEHNDIRWITTEEIPQYEFCPADETILKKLRSGDTARREEKIRMEPVYYTVTSIDGDYAHIISDSGVENQVAMLLLPEAYPILYVGLASGLRQGELISLPWAAVDACGRRAVLKKHWVGLSARAAELMTEEHARHPDSIEAFLDAKAGLP